MLDNVSRLILKMIDAIYQIGVHVVTIRVAAAEVEIGTKKYLLLKMKVLNVVIVLFVAIIEEVPVVSVVFVYKSVRMNANVVIDAMVNAMVLVVTIVPSFGEIQKNFMKTLIILVADALIDYVPNVSLYVKKNV